MDGCGFGWEVWVLNVKCEVNNMQMGRIAITGVWMIGMKGGGGGCGKEVGWRWS